MGCFPPHSLVVEKNPPPCTQKNPPPSENLSETPRSTPSPKKSTRPNTWLHIHTPNLDPLPWIPTLNLLPIKHDQQPRSMYYPMPPPPLISMLYNKSDDARAMPAPLGATLAIVLHACATVCTHKIKNPHPIHSADRSALHCDHHGVGMHVVLQPRHAPLQCNMCVDECTQGKYAVC